MRKGFLYTFLILGLLCLLISMISLLGAWAMSDETTLFMMFFDSEGFGIVAVVTFLSGLIFLIISSMFKE